MATTIQGIRVVELDIDAETHRTYSVTYLIRGNSANDGPATVANTPGLPLIGSPWLFGSEADIWAWRRPNAKVKRHPQIEDGETGYWWTWATEYSTKPPERGNPQTQRCNDQQFDDPLFEPPKITISGQRYTEEVALDRHGRLILTSSFELIRGPQVEFDASRVTVRIEQNVATYADAVTLPVSMLDTVNTSPLWGLAQRTIKLSGYSAEPRYYGQCYKYYNRTLEFDARGDGFDRDVLDEGAKVLKGHWDTSTGEYVLDNIAGAAPDPGNPAHFIQYKDRQGENTRVVLNGAGLPAYTTVTANNQFVARADSTGAALTNSLKWIPLVGSSTPPAWSETVYYVKGNLVEADAGFFLCLQNHLDDEPPTSRWLALPGGVNVLGNYNASTSYLIGDIVTGTLTTTAGSIHIERYSESDFLLLGIPATF